MEGKKLFKVSFGFCDEIYVSRLFWVPEEASMLELQRTYNKALRKYRKWKGKERKKGEVILDEVALEDFMFKALEEAGWIPFQLDYEIAGSIDNLTYSVKPISQQNQHIMVSEEKEKLILNRI
jgi:hypothetical protein